MLVACGFSPPAFDPSEELGCQYIVSELPVRS
jgi:hypothetical protein